MIEIRASSLPAYNDCQLRAAGIALSGVFRAHGYEMRPRRPTIGALIGSGNHAAGEAGLKERMLSGTTMPLSAMEDAAIEEYRRRKTEEQETGEELVLDSTTTREADAEPTIRKMVNVYRRDVVATAHPLMVERRMVQPFNEHVRLAGTGDLLHLDETEEGKAIVRDQKGGHVKRKPEVHAAQIGAYSLLDRAAGYETHGAQIDFVLRSRPGKPQPAVEFMPLDVGRAEVIAYATLDDFAAKAVAFAADGDTRRFIPNPGSFLCSEKYCRLFGQRACAATYQGE